MEKLISAFKITPFDIPQYKSRLEKEFDLLFELNYIDYILRIVQIYTAHIDKYPNMLRGSSGSSLILYYLGISKIDPVKYSIPLSRFINRLRKTPPDIDIDIPLSLRDTLIADIINLNEDCVRMSSNYKNEDNKYFAELIKEDPTFNSTHSSGIIIYDSKQKDIIDKYRILPKQISLTKSNFNDYGLKKIDLLANTGLDQIYKISTKPIHQYDFTDSKVYEFISQDDGIGITYAETPQIQNVIKILKPSNIEQLSICLSIVRPLACHHISKNITWDNLKDKIIYDDDFIIWVQNKLGLGEEEADDIRRTFKSNTDKEKMNRFIEKVDLSMLALSDKFQLKKTLLNLSRYSFCKSHSLNYAQMIYCLYWNKYYNPKLFWLHSIKIIKGFYRDWVYVRKGLDYGLKFKGIENCSPFYHLVYTGYWIGKEFVSRCYLRKLSSDNNLVLENNDIDVKLQEQVEEQIEAQSDNPDKILLDSNNSIYLEEKIKYDTEYEFRGIIAGIGNISTKYKKYQMVITIGYDNNKFINLHLNKKRDLSKFKQVMGKGYWIDEPQPYIVITKMMLM
jgi:DNA polymerase III alpha subunit